MHSLDSRSRASRSLGSWSLGWAGCLLLTAATACGGAPEAKPPETPKPVHVAAPAAVAQDETAPSLRTGERPPTDLGEVKGAVASRFDDGSVETLEIVFAMPRGDDTGLYDAEVVPEAPGSLFSFLDPREAEGRANLGYRAMPRQDAEQRSRVWLRRPKGTTTPLRATIVASGLSSRSAGSRFVVTAPEPTQQAPSAAADPKLRASFAEALEQYFKSRHGSIFGADAAMRVHRAYGPEPKKKESKPRGPTVRVDSPMDRDLAELMRATTGIGALRAALGHDRTLLAGPSAAPSLPLSTLQGPKLDTHPWAKMQAKLGAKAPAEPMADLAPADGWYVRAASLGTLFRLLDEADAWGTSAARLAEDVAFDADLATRYETQLGIRRSEMARRFGDRVVGEVALVGSDPYVREGTDVTLLFRLKAAPLFDGAMADSLADRAEGHGALTTSSASYEGIDISIVTSADGAVRRHRATIGDVAVVSNSLAATKRVIATAKGKAPALSKEPDIGYALARDAAEPADVIALVSERLVRTIVGPAHKIAEARRQTARAELLAPGAAAVLHGWLRGGPPASADALVAARLLDKAELTHERGGAISFTPGQAPRSAWGTPAFMEPLVDRPAVDKVTPGEHDAYEAFKRAYEQGWAGEPFDPIALRLALPEKGPMSAHVRVLPIPRDRDMDELMRVVGDKRVVVEPSGSGARLVVGLSPDDRWRREIGLDLGRMIGGERRVLDWIGEWAAIGVADRNGLLVAGRHELAPEPRDPEGDGPRVDDELELLGHLPLWVGVDVRSPATLGILLTVMRKLADDVIPGMMRWGEVGKEGNVAVIGVRISADAISRGAKDTDQVNVFYSIVPASGTTRSALYVSLKEDILRQLVRDHAAGRGPRSPAAPSSGVGSVDPRSAQAFIDVATARGGAIATFLSWIAESSARDQQSSSGAFAEWFLRAGVSGHEAELARAYIGAVPTTPSGKAYTWGPGGVTDPDRGSRAAPRWPALPVAGTPMAAIVEAVGRARISTSFETEPLSTEADPLRSFTARITIDKR